MKQIFSYTTQSFELGDLYGRMIMAFDVGHGDVEIRMRCGDGRTVGVTLNREEANLLRQALAQESGKWG